jgi:hypothetical protein
MDTAECREKAAAGGALGQFLRSVGRAGGRAALGAAGGAALSGIEEATGYADPNMTPWGHGGLFAGNMMAGALAAQPGFRRWMWRKPQAIGGAPAMGPNQPPTSYPTVWANKYRPVMATSGALAVAALPKYVSMADSSGQLARKLSDRLRNAPAEYWQPYFDPRGYIEGRADKAVRDFGASPAVRDFAGAAGTTLGGGITGAIAGGALGGMAGHLLARDDPTLGYEARRRRERWRTLLGLGGTAAGGIAGPLLLARYAPNLIPGLIQRGLGGAKPAGA